jgi:hypothetical protein
MTFFIKNGNTYNISDEAALDIKTILPAGNYVVKFDQMKGIFFLEQVESFDLPTKMYGNVTRHSGRIINTFFDRSASTGVLLTGEKGSGKTLLSKRICMDLAEVHKVPTLIINTAFTGDGFNKFIQSIEQPCAILFDEFEKTFDAEEQEQLLTLLDGVFGSKKLFLLTCNNKWRIDSHMLNRPGRIFYSINFKGLELSFIREYCEDQLVNKEHINKICEISGLFGEFNFDLLKALVEEMNRYNETPQEALEMLNAKPQNGGDQTKYEVRFFDGAVELFGEEDSNEVAEFVGNPLSTEEQHFWVRKENKNKETVEEDSLVPGLSARLKKLNRQTVCLTVSSQKLTKVDAHAGKFIFEDQGTKIVMTRIKTKEFNFDAF